MNCYRIKANGVEGLIIGELSNIAASMPDGYLIEEAVSIGKGAYVNNTWDNNVKDLFPPLEADSKEADSKESDSKEADSKEADSKEADSEESDSEESDSEEVL